MIVRTAIPKDITSLMNLGLNFFSSLPYLQGIIPFDQDSFGEFLFSVMRSCTGRIFCVEHDGRIIGMAGVISSPSWFNRDHISAQEVFWWVEEEFRGSGAGAKLFNAIEAFSSEIGAHSITISSTSMDNAQKLREFYAKRGYVQNDINYIKGVAPCRPAS